MENAINNLRIQNFKSIKDVTMKPRRVNLIIGMPNVGKSNILEAMSLLGGMFFDREGSRFMEGQIRYEEPRQMFYDNLVANAIKVESDKDVSLIGKNKKLGNFASIVSSLKSYKRILEEAEKVSKGAYLFGNEDELIINDFPNLLDVWRNTYSPVSEYIYTEFKNEKGFNIDMNISSATMKYFKNKSTKYYKYIKDSKIDAEYNTTFLRPPYGNNLVDVIQAYPKFRKLVADLFSLYGLKLLLRIDERKFDIIKDLEGVIYSYPYSSIADTLQRIIFYLAAIESNDDSVLLFEEPEAHTFPVYTSMLGRKIAESKNNQFFIATHSPYLVTEIMEQLLPEEGQEGELAIFLAYYEGYQTKVKQLSDEEVREIRNDSIDVFYNLSRFTPGSNSYA